MFGRQTFPVWTGLKLFLLFCQFFYSLICFYPFVNVKVIFQNTHQILLPIQFKDRPNRSQLSKVKIKLVVGTAMILILHRENDTKISQPKDGTFQGLFET